MTTFPESRKLVWLAAMFAICYSVQAGEGVAPAAANTTAGSPPPVKFRPPTSGAPSVRVTGGSRGIGDSEIKLDVLAPDDVGLTTMEQPSLFWFQSKPAESKFELTLLQENKVKPLVHVMSERSNGAGVQRLKLSEHGVKLAPNVEYQWVVALIVDPDNRSSDLVASGVIKRIEASPELKRKVAAASPAGLAGLYAQEGMWYDSLDALSDRIASEPENRALRQSRADLLRQVGLEAAAVFESQALAANKGSSQ